MNPATATGVEPQLKRGIVPFIGSLTQSVALLGPSAGIGLVVAGVVGVVGSVAWFTWLIGMIAIGCVAYAILALSRRFLTTGGLYPLAGKAAGTLAGYFTAFGALVWLIVAAPAVIIQTGIFMAAFLNLPAFGIPETHAVVMIVSLVTLLATGGLAYWGIHIATRVMLAIEGTTLAAILVLVIITFAVHHGGIVDPAEFRFSGLSASTIISGLVLVVFAFGGFESATILGQEARRGQRDIPRAVLGSVIVAGLFFMVATYAMVLGFSGTRYDLATSPSALGQLAIIDGVTWYAYIVNAALVAATFGVNIALYNAGARLLYTLPREGIGPAWLRRVSARRQTPVSGILVFLLVNLVVVLVVGFGGISPVAAFDDLGTLSGYGTSVMYLVTAVAAALFLARLRPRQVVGVVISLLGALIMAYGLYTSFVPFPAYPTSIFTGIFIGFALLAIGGVFLLTGRPGPKPFQGNSVDEDTGLATGEGTVAGTTMAHP
jgi:amino acid transporter